MSPPPLSHEEHLEVLACIHELHRCRSLAAFPEHALRALTSLVPSPLAAFNEVNVRRGRTTATMSRHFDDLDRMESTFERLSAQHPLLRYAVDSGDGQAVKISDFLSETEYHELDIYRDLYEAVGAEDQMSITIRSDAGVVLALAFNRARRDFTERERVKLNLIRPHLVQAYANVEELTDHLEEKADLQTALRETGHGVIGLDRDDRMAHATPGAPECLARFFPDVPSPDFLPPALGEWLASDPRTPFRLHTRDAVLIVRNPRHTTRRLLLLSEECCRALPGGQRLTPRETEVLRWIAEGKSNPEIAAILGVATGTVKLHVQSILAKLGVANRTAAATLARERALVPPPDPT